jgi:tripartite-type tricarboxylate transporter receptor subunit TctC
MMEHKVNRRTVLQAGLGMGMLPLTRAAAAQSAYPNRPIRVVVGLPAGGVADMAVRIITTQMQATMGQPFVIDNKPGGSFVLAMNEMEQAPADGYTLTYATNMMLSAQAVLKRYDLFKSLTPIAMIGASEMALAVGGNSKFSSVSELVEFGRANPRKLTYGTPGIGLLEHLTLATFCKRNGIEAVHVPYKGGPQVVHAIGSGEVDFCVTPLSLLLQFESKNLIRGLAILNEQRSTALPQLPTYQEARVDIPRLVLWGGFAAKAGTPGNIVSALERHTLLALRHEETRARLVAMGRNMAIEGDAAYAARLWSADWAWISRAAGEITLDKT